MSSDDHGVMAEGLKALLPDEFELVGEAANSCQFRLPSGKLARLSGSAVITAL